MAVVRKKELTLDNAKDDARNLVSQYVDGYVPQKFVIKRSWLTSAVGVVGLVILAAIAGYQKGIITPQMLAWVRSHPGVAASVEGVQKTFLGPLEQTVAANKAELQRAVKDLGDEVYATLDLLEERLLAEKEAFNTAYAENAAKTERMNKVLYDGTLQAKTALRAEFNEVMKGWEARVDEISRVQQELLATRAALHDVEMAGADVQPDFGALADNIDRINKAAGDNAVAQEALVSAMELTAQLTTTKAEIMKGVANQLQTLTAQLGNINQRLDQTDSRVATVDNAASANYTSLDQRLGQTEANVLKINTDAKTTFKAHSDTLDLASEVVSNLNTELTQAKAAMDEIRQTPSTVVYDMRQTYVDKRSVNVQQQREQQTRERLNLKRPNRLPSRGNLLVNRPRLMDTIIEQGEGDAIVPLPTGVMVPYSGTDYLNNNNPAYGPANNVD